MSDEAASTSSTFQNVASSAASNTISNGGLSSFLIRHPTLIPFKSHPGLTRLYNNIGSAIITILYVKIVMEIGTYIRVKYGVPELSRKFVHFCACSIVIFWPLFDPAHWGWRLNVTVPVVMSLRLLYKGAILKDPEDEDVRSMSRTSSPSELLYGPLQMTLIMSYVGLNFFMTEAGMLIMASLVGDGLAALVGLQYGKHKYKVPFCGDKSVEGTFGCVIGTVTALWFFFYMCGMDAMGWRELMTYGVLSATAEASSLHKWDNLLLAVAMEISAKYVPHYFGR